MKKMFALILALAMCLGLLAGCGSSASSEATSAASAESAASEAQETEAAEDAEEAEPAAAAEEAEPASEPASEAAEEATVDSELPDDYPMLTDTGVTSLTVFQEINPQMADAVDSYDELPFWQEVEARTGIDLEWTMVGSASAEEQFNLLVAADDLTNIVCTLSYWDDGISAAVENDVFVNLADYIDAYAPDYAALANADENYPVLHDENGDIIGFYEIGEKEFVPNNGVFLREDMLEEQGLDVPVTYDEYESVLLQVKDAYDLEAPIFHYPDNYLWISSGYGVKEGFSLNDDGEVIYGPIEDGYREYLETMAKWYSEGLIYKDFYSIPDGSNISYMVDYMSSSKSFVTFGYCEFAGMIELPEGGEFAAGYMPRTDADAQLHLTEGVDSRINSGRGYALGPNSTEEEVETACMLLNYFYTEEGALFANYGTEGVSFEYQEDGTPWYTDAILDNPDGLTQTQSLLFYIGYMAPCYADFTKYNISSLTTWKDFVDVWATADNANTMPAVSLTAEEMEDYSAKAADVETYMDEVITKFIIGEMDINDDAVWQEYLDKMDALGASDMLEIYQAAYERYLDI